MFVHAYDYLKAMPSERAKLVTANWHLLSMDEDCPPVVRQELVEMTKKGINLSDAALFWHKLYVGTVICAEDIKRVTMPQEWSALNTKWSEYLYSLYQLEMIDGYTAWTMLCSLQPSNYNLEGLNMELCLKIANIDKQAYAFNTSRPRIASSFYAVLFKALTDIDVQQNDNAYCEIAINTCTVEFLRTLKDRYQLDGLTQLIRDTDFEKGSKKFASRNEIDAAHDARTERLTQELMMTHKGKGYNYSKALLELVKEYGFFMPTGPDALIKRGQQHSNCVATYVNKHEARVDSSNSFRSVSRIFFTKDATLELSCEIAHGVIVGTTTLQYKGRYNKDINRDENLTALRIALTGQPFHIITVEKMEVKDDNNIDG